MPASTTGIAGDLNDSDPKFVHAVSLLAALEEARDHPGHAVVLPFLGMARAELTDFGQRRPAHYVEVQKLHDFRTGLADLEQRLIALLADSQVLQHTLRIDAALQLVRRGTAGLT